METAVVTVQVTLVAVIINVNARAQRLSEHPEITTQGGSSNPLKTHTHKFIQTSPWDSTKSILNKVDSI